MVMALLAACGPTSPPSSTTDDDRPTGLTVEELPVEDDSMMEEDDAMMEEDDSMMEDDTAMEEDDTMAEGEVQEFTIDGSNFSFTPNTMTVNEGDTVRITLVNDDNMPHDFVLDEFDARTEILNTGETETIEFVADEAGTFEYYCSVGNHRAMGMVGTLIVQ